MNKIPLIAALSFGFVFANPTEDLTRAKGFFNQGKYLDASPLLGSLVEGNSPREIREEALAFLAEAEIRLGRVDKSLDRVVEYESLYPNGNYLESMAFVRARIDLFEGLAGRSASRLIQLLANTKDEALYLKVSEQMQEILSSATLAIDELNRLVHMGGLEAKVVYPLRMDFAKRLIREGRYKSARFYLRGLLRDFPESSQEINDVGVTLKGKGAGKGVILVVAPLNGPFADFGSLVAQGIALAYEESNRQDLSFQMVDSHGEPAYTVAKVQELMKVENVVGVLGPIMSDNASALAAWMSSAVPEIPMITPTATDRDIARLGDNVFQLNVPVYRMAADIAKYTSRCMNKKQSVVLAPRSSYGRIMSEAWVESFENTGGQVLSVAFYNEGETDYNKVFNSLRHLALQQHKQKLALKYKTDDLSKVMSSKDVDKWMMDSTVTFESVFIAASDPADAALLAKQLHFAKIKGDIVGSSGWNGKDVIRQGGRDIADVVFSVGFYEENAKESFVQFAKAFRQRWNQYPDPDKVAGLSYDGMKLLLRGIQPAGGNVLDRLKEIKDFTGVYGTVKLNEAGENVNSQLVKIENFKFTPIDFCKD